MTFSLKRDVELKFLSMSNTVDRIKYKNYGEKKMKKKEERSNEKKITTYFTCQIIITIRNS